MLYQVTLLKDAFNAISTEERRSRVTAGHKVLLFFIFNPVSNSHEALMLTKDDRLFSFCSLCMSTEPWNPDRLFPLTKPIIGI